MATCCFCHCINDVEPRPFHPADIYQQIKIIQRRRTWFMARAIGPTRSPSTITAQRCLETLYFYGKLKWCTPHCGALASPSYEVMLEQRWEMYRGGWVDEGEDTAKVAGGSVLVERFAVKRLNSGVVVAFDFVHLNKVRAKQL
nr:unnamed protein product [Digitaria exilis]